MYSANYHLKTEKTLTSSSKKSRSGLIGTGFYDFKTGVLFYRAINNCLAPTLRSDPFNNSTV
jgi:hypothetical protein